MERLLGSGASGDEIDLSDVQNHPPLPPPFMIPNSFRDAASVRNAAAQSRIDRFGEFSRVRTVVRIPSFSPSMQACALVQKYNKSSCQPFYPVGPEKLHEPESDAPPMGDGDSRAGPRGHATRAMGDPDRVRSSDSIENQKKGPGGSQSHEQLPRLLRPLEWVTVEVPARLHEFLYSKRNILICLDAAIAAYLITLVSGQPELVARTLAVFAFAAGCWILEVFPIAITGLMIPVAVSLTGIFTPPRAFSSFAHPVIFLLLGGLVLGRAVSKFGLDKRIAHWMVVRSGGRIDALVLLTVGVVGFISMWMSNTVAVAVLLPVFLTILSSIPEVYQNFKRKLLLSLIICTSLGGMAMLTGSPPNMIAAAQLEHSVGFGFSHWAYYGTPIVLASLAITFVTLKYRYPSPKVTLDISSVAGQKDVSGPMSPEQKRVVGVFGATVALWFFGSEAEVLLGLPPSISSSAIVSVLSVLVLFGMGLLNLRDVTSVQWELIFLLGGGILLGEAMLATGSASIIASAVAAARAFLPEILILALLMLLTLLLTNFISNSATAAIMAPIAFETARALAMSPVPFVMGVGLTASLAFITPVGTTSTAMVYATGLVPKGFLAKNGLLIGVPILIVILAFVWLLPLP
ncbi:MAG: DASS family sodium-coupled anion symporter [Thermoplasmata archaeon]